MATGWTNKSVRLLAQGGDPERVIIARARELTLQMLEAGWPGPPFDPLWVAERIGAEIVPVADAPDARTIPTGTGRYGVRIEYNPDRPTSRRRFSIAHEIAHLLFDDVAEATRYRAEVDRRGTDDWQLELLCNLGAAEIAMPVGSLEGELETEPAVRSLVDLHGRLDVSYEALALRVVRLTDFQVAAFATSRVSPTDPRPIRLDYAFASRAWTASLPRRGPIKPEGLADCTAVGYTSGADEVRWPGLQEPTRMECIGVPPFPGHRWPRVLGFLFGGRGTTTERVRIVLGDATSPMGDPPWIVTHVVNDRARTWHAGFAAALRRRHPDSQRAFIQHALKYRLQLGDIVATRLSEDLIVVSMIAQAGYGQSKTPRIRYQALRDCLVKLAAVAAEFHATVHMPRIGTGQAGGRWPIVAGLVDEELAARGVPVIVYELPGTEATMATQEELPL